MIEYKATEVRGAGVFGPTYQHLPDDDPGRLHSGFAAMTAIVHDAREHFGGVAADRQRQHILDVEGGDADIATLAFAQAGKGGKVLAGLPEARQP